MHSTKAPFVMPLDRYMMVVPNVLAWQCDVCGMVEYNEAFLEKVDILLDQIEEDQMIIHRSDLIGHVESPLDFHTGGRGDRS
jgi:hypothetical protein